MKTQGEGQIIELETTLPFKYKLLIFFSVLLVVFIILAAFLEMKCKIKQINVTGNTWYSDEEITEALQTGFLDKYSVFFRLHYIFSDTPEMAFVDKITIRFESSDTINIRVYEKKIVGCVYEMGDYLYFDKDGYIVSSRSEQLNNVPRIDGLEYTSLTMNHKLEVQAEEMFDVILEVTQLINKYEVDVDTINFDGNRNITLYCTDKNQIYLGNRDSYDAVIQAIPNILKAAEEKTAIYWLDMSEFTPSNTTIPAEFIENYGSSQGGGDSDDGDGTDPEPEDDGEEVTDKPD
ncbi:MAG: cell division protein FtsQ/DivIB [Lachnospiraceae bacterium]